MQVEVQLIFTHRLTRSLPRYRVPMACRQMFTPAEALAGLVVPSKLVLVRDNPLSESLCAWCGFFWLTLCTTLVHASYQPRSPGLQSQLRAMAVLWAVDAVYIKWGVFRRSGVVRFPAWCLAGCADASVAVACFYFSRCALPSLRK